MMERKAKTKFLLPVLIALVLVVILVSGSLYLRSSLMKLTMEERSSQLE